MRVNRSARRNSAIISLAWKVCEECLFEGFCSFCVSDEIVLLFLHISAERNARGSKPIVTGSTEGNRAEFGIKKDLNQVLFCIVWQAVYCLLRAEESDATCVELCESFLAAKLLCRDS